jgi:4-hydroxy-tetrahydrodipicolinate synthase
METWAASIRCNTPSSTPAAEGAAVDVRRTIEALGTRLRVLNGRGGLELLDNLRAGCAGMIPATDTFDYQVRIYEYMASGREDDERLAMELYRRILPAIVFTMQSLDSLICYGKRLAALWLGLTAVHDRSPAMTPTAFGQECVRRYGKELVRSIERAMHDRARDCDHIACL